jgi:hypothetical protein
MRFFSRSSSVAPSTQSSNSVARSIEAVELRPARKGFSIAAVFAGFTSCFSIDPSMYTPEDELMDAMGNATVERQQISAERQLAATSASSASFE